MTNRFVCVIFCSLLMVVVSFASGAEVVTKPQSVLVLNSYHAGYSWSDGELQGLQRVFLKEFPGLISSVEFLDTKRDPTLRAGVEQLRFIQHKYAGVSFDLIVTLDDAALKFALDNRALLGAEVPIVFGGVNNYQPERFAGIRRLTGVAEGFDFESNLELALRLRPGLKTVHLLLDSAESTVQTLEAFEKVAVRFHDRLRFEKISGWTADELLVRLGALPPGDMVLYLGGVRDVNGRIISEDEGYIRTLNERSAVPIIMVNQPVLTPAYGSSWENAVWLGTGGYMTVPADLHGEAIGRLAARVLRGEEAGSIPVVTVSPTRLAFDYRQVERHNIDLARMPAGAEFINRKLGFYELYRGRIFGVLAVVLALAGTVVFLLFNIWRRKSVERELVLLRTAVDQAKEFVALLGPGGDVLYSNTSLARVLRGEGAGPVRCDELWRVANGSVVPFSRIRVLADENGHWQQRVPLSREGGQLLLQLIVTPIRAAATRETVFLLIGQDVTQEARLEEQVRVSQKMDAIGTLASGVAHDFNNILTSILVNSEMAQSEIQAGHPAEDMLAEIRKATDRASHLVRQILTFSRHAEPRREIMAVTSIVDESLKFLRATIPASVEVKHTVNGSPAIEVDPTQLYQVILNLCTNAVHAIGSRPGVVEVSEDTVDVGGDLIAIHPDLKPGPHLRLSVKDSGEGMRPEVVQRIFEPFFTTKGPGKGTGLGLSVVHGIVKQHHAAITVYSSPGRGSVFHLFFPVAGVMHLQRDLVPDRVLPQTTERGEGEHIVLVDDEQSIKQAAGKALENAGYRVASFNLPDQALLYLRTTKADLLITDFSMPGIGGLGLVEQIRLSAPDLPVVMISGYVSEANRAKAAEMGVSTILDKPLSVQALLEAVKRGLGRRS